MRLFVALGVPRAARSRILAALGDGDRLPREGVTWTRPEGWHLTLAFIGEVPDAHEALVNGCVSAAVAAWDGPPLLELATAGCTALGRVAVALEIEDVPAGAVAQLGRQIQGALESEGVPVNLRRVRPHLTLARVRGGADPRRVARQVQVPPVSWEVDHVQVVASILGGGPARYEVRSRLPLG